MMKLSQLVKVSSKARKMNAEFVKIVGYKEGRNKKGFAVAIAKSYSPVIYKDGKEIKRNIQLTVKKEGFEKKLFEDIEKSITLSVKWLDCNRNISDDIYGFGPFVPNIDKSLINIFNINTYQ